jgi:hypothetical protein
MRYAAHSSGGNERHVGRLVNPAAFIFSDRVASRHAAHDAHADFGFSPP